MRRRTRILAWIGGGLLLLLLLLAGGITLLLQSRPGHDLFLRMALRQLPQYLNGQVEIDGVHSEGLLGGFTLRGIAIRDDAGRPFLEADSIGIRYALAGFFRREIVLVPVDAWGVRVTVETLHGDTLSNLERIFQTSEESTPAAPARFSLVLRDLEIAGGELLLRSPLLSEEERSPGAVIESLPEIGGEYRLIRFDGIEALVEEAEVVRPGEEGQRFLFDRLSLDGYLFETPFTLEDFRGEVLVEGPLISISAERLRFPESEMEGELLVDLSDPARGIGLEGEINAPLVTLSDLRWFEPRLPDGSGDLVLSFAGYLLAGEGEIRVTTTDFRAGSSRVQGSAGFDLEERVILPDSEIELLPLDIADVTEWLENPPEIGGRLSGRVRGAGPLDRLILDGVLTYDDLGRGIPASQITFEGGLRLGEDPGFADLSLLLDPMRYETLRALAPESEFVGDGRIRLNLSGRLSTGVALTAEVDHSLPGFPVSRVTADGTIRRIGEVIEVDLLGEIESLSIEGISAGFGSETELAGRLSGPFEARGTFADLFVSTTLSTPGGSVVAEGNIDLRSPEGSYRLEGRVEDFRLQAILPNLPDSTRMTGTFLVDGRGREAQTLDGVASMNLTNSMIAGVAMDTVDLRVLARGGELVVEEMEVIAPLLRLSGSGTLPIVETLPPGEIFVTWEAVSLEALRPLLFGTDPIATDPLSALERDILRLEGVDVDSIDAEGGDQIGGSARGEIRLQGRSSELAGTGLAEVTGLIYGRTNISTGRADFVGSWARGGGWSTESAVDLESFSTYGFGFAEANGEMAFGDSGDGSFSLLLVRSTGESYQADGDFVRDSAETAVALQTLTLEVGEDVWALTGPAGIRWADSILTVENFRVARPAGIAGGGAAGIEAEGTFGEETAILSIQAEGLDLARIEALLQRNDLPDGTLDFVLDIGGSFSSPEIAGSFMVEDLASSGAGLNTLSGEVEYLDQRMNLLIDGVVEGRSILSLEGHLPLDLSFRRVEERLLDRELELTLSLREFPAGMLAPYLPGIEEIEGVLDGEVRFGGTPRDFRPNGNVALRDGSLFLSEFGIRPSAIIADFLLQENGTVVVDARANGPGPASVTGTVSLSDLRDPEFSLTIEASGFQAVDRRDLSAQVGGSVTLVGRYSSPQLLGTVRVEDGEMIIEEFVRSAEVIDLSDRLIFRDLVDTTLVSIRPVVEAAQNPFVQNLLVEVDLVIQRDFWLRSREMDVEMEGALSARFDRAKKEIVLAGTLAATRGSYTFGRQFEVVSGNVEFFGTPGVNPALDIQAVTRLRREGGTPLNVTANVQGTLLDPTVVLTSDAQPPIEESELISYLIFGRPTFALTSGESSALAEAAGAGVSLGIGALASQVGQLLAQEIGVDYISIESVGFESISGISESFVGTQIEVGQYLGNELFMALTLRPLTEFAAGSRLPGARLEWQFTDTWSMEGFVEDRFAREGGSGFGELGLRTSKVWGFSLFREWGY